MIGGGIRYLTGGDVFDAKAIAIDAAAGAAGVGIVSGVKHLSKLSKLRQVAKIRQDYGVKASQNIAYADVRSAGTSSRLIGISGKAPVEGTVGVPSVPRFSAVATGRNPRIYDSEKKLLEHIAGGFDDGSSGSVKLFTERPPCVSCEGVISQFSSAFPNVSLNVGHGGTQGLSALDAVVGGVIGQGARQVVYPSTSFGVGSSAYVKPGK